MPELPEVEITKRGVEGRFFGQKLIKMTVRQPQLRWKIPEEVHACEGFPLTRVDRRSKLVLLGFGEQVQLLHLGMSGALRFVSDTEPWAKHDHVEWRFENGALRLNDPRRFGSLDWSLSANLGEHPRLLGLGVEPFSSDFTSDLLYRQSRGRTQSVKVWLLSGKAVVGVGNIYASEVLFRSGIRPGRAAGRLTRKDCDLLCREVVAVLGEAIERGGSTLRNFHAIDGELGYFQLSCMVYGREGEPCRVCGDAIRRRVIAQRSTFFCRRCQK